MKRLRQHRAPLIALLSANAVSQFGSMLTVVALPWFVLQTTGSPSKAGITLAVDSVPIFVAGLFGGALVDRIGYKLSSVLADLVSAVMVAAIPLLYMMVGLQFWQLLALVFLGALVNVPGRTARSSLIPDLAHLAGMSLARVNSLDQGVPRLALLLGPPISGLLVALMGASNVLWVDAGTFFVSALLVVAGVTIPVVKHEIVRQSILSETFAGLKHIRRDRLLLWIVIAESAGSLISEPIYTIVYPVYAREIYGSAVVLGVMYSALAVGSLTGLVLYGAFGSRLPRRFVLIGGFAVRAISFWVMVARPSITILLASIAINALCLEPVNPLVTSILQERTPAGLRGRVFGAFSAIGIGTLPIGIMIGGFLLGGPGLMPTLVIISVASAAHVASLFAIPAFRAMSSTPVVRLASDPVLGPREESRFEQGPVNPVGDSKPAR